MKRLTYERRIQLLALAAGLPGSFIALILLWTGSYSSGSAWTLTFFILSQRLTYERRIQLLALAAGLPGSFIALILLWTGVYSSGSAWTLTFLILSLWLGFALSLRHRVVFSLQTLSNLLAAMREEDFSIRARGARPDDAMGEVMIEVNALSTMLREQRLGAMEATGLLRTIIEEIDLAIF